MSKERQETAEWAPGSACEKCGIPFFWNFKEMWSQKTVGVRQVRGLNVFMTQHLEACCGCIPYLELGLQ